MLQRVETLDERVETARLPGAQEAGKREACQGACRRARAAADLAHDDERAQTAFGQIVVRRYAGLQHELEQLVLMAQSNCSALPLTGCGMIVL